MKTSELTVLHVEYNDLDIAVTKFLRKKKLLKKTETFDSIAIMQWHNDSYYLHDNLDEIDEFERKWDKIDVESGDFEGKLDYILKWMAAEDVIEKAEYLIHVSW